MLALELEVVDRDDGLGVLARPGVPEEGVEVDRHEARLPVVAVDDVRFEPDDGEGGQDRLVEEDELSKVLRHAGVGVAVGEILLVVDEVVDDAVLLEFHDADILHDARARDVHVEVTDILHALFILVRDARVLRHHDPDVDAFRGKSLGQGAHDVSESACFREGVAFGTNKQYFHGIQLLYTFFQNKFQLQYTMCIRKKPSSVAMHGAESYNLRVSIREAMYIAKERVPL